MALKLIASKEKSELTSAREVCDEFGSPFDTTAKVMQIMNQNDILSSIKGVKGGYTLSKPLNRISYKELVEMIEGKKFESLCRSEKGMCDLYKNCNIRTPVESLNDKLNDFLGRLCLDELLFGVKDVDGQLKISKEDEKHVN